MCGYPAGSVLAADLTVGTVSSSLKVRPADAPVLSPTVALKAARNEFEAFQIVLQAGATQVDSVTARVSKTFVGPGGATIPAGNVVLYVERYYNVVTASNDEGAPGLWPDPLVPDVDTYFGEKRNAFPVSVPAHQNRVVWVDLLVPQTQAAGDYAGEIQIDVAGVMQAAVPVSLHVGTFSLPSTASLATAFGMRPDMPAGAHGMTAPVDAIALKGLYTRAALEHRFSLSRVDFLHRTPFWGAELAAFEANLLPLIKGTGPTRLPGAKLTAITHRSTDPTAQAPWIVYAKANGFFDRLVYYPVDEPGTDQAEWDSFKNYSDNLHAADPSARIIITASIQSATAGGAVDKIDIFCPPGEWYLEGKPGYDPPYPDGNQRPKYDAWLGADPNRRMWFYQACGTHGCGECDHPSPGLKWTGWPNRVVDISGVQGRAFEWQAYLFRVVGELYWDVGYFLDTAWDNQCGFSGSGDGNLFYPGTPARIGGTTDIPIESIRMKLLREGMEDYEYLIQVAAVDPALATAVALELFPHMYQSAQPPASLEAARDLLFTALDQPVDTTHPEAPKNLKVW